MAGVSHSEHKVWSFFDDRFHTGIDKSADFGQPTGFGGIVAVSRDTHQTRAKTEGKYSFGDAGRKGNDSLRARPFCCEDILAVQDDEAHNKQISEDLFTLLHQVHRVNKTMTDVSLNSPTAPKVSPVTPPRRR